MGGSGVWVSYGTGSHFGGEVDRYSHRIMLVEPGYGPKLIRMYLFSGSLCSSMGMRKWRMACHWRNGPTGPEPEHAISSDIGVVSSGAGQATLIAPPEELGARVDERELKTRARCLLAALPGAYCRCLAALAPSPPRPPARYLEISATAKALSIHISAKPITVLG